MSAQTSILGVELASDKEGTKRILADAEYQCQKVQLSTTWTSLKKREAVGGYPIVIKPDGNHGRGITIDIRSWSEAEQPTMPPKMFPGR